MSNMSYIMLQRRSGSAKMPHRATPGSIGYDVYADLPVGWTSDGTNHAVRICAGERVLVPLGFSMQPPAGCYGRLAPRSGLAFKKGVDIMAGVVDPDYRGIVHALVINLGHNPVVIEHGEAIAQLILERAEIATPIEVDSLEPTARDEGGFGSTG